MDQNESTRGTVEELQVGTGGIKLTKSALRAGLIVLAHKLTDLSGKPGRGGEIQTGHFIVSVAEGKE